jgi:hypothetical protein
VEELHENDQSLKTWSGIFGVSYTFFFTWCLVAQAWANFVNSSCKGYSTDFALIGFVGFYFLLWNQLEGYVDAHSEAGHVNVMDLTFALGATIFSSISYMQTFIYPNEKATLAT